MARCRPIRAQNAAHTVFEKPATKKKFFCSSGCCCSSAAEATCPPASSAGAPPAPPLHAPRVVWHKCWRSHILSCLRLPCLLLVAPPLLQCHTHSCAMVVCVPLPRRPGPASSPLLAGVCRTMQSATAAVMPAWLTAAQALGCSAVPDARELGVPAAHKCLGPVKHHAVAWLAGLLELALLDRLGGLGGLALVCNKESEQDITRTAWWWRTASGRAAGAMDVKPGRPDHNCSGPRWLACDIGPAAAREGEAGACAARAFRRVRPLKPPVGSHSNPGGLHLTLQPGPALPGCPRSPCPCPASPGSGCRAPAGAICARQVQRGGGRRLGRP